MEKCEEALNLLRETALLLQKAHINLKKCPKARLTKGYVQSRLESLDQYWQSFLRYHQQLISLTTVEDRAIIPFIAKDEFFMHEETYLCTRADLKDMLESLTPSFNTHASTSLNLTPPRSEIQVKLPRIQLPTFSGNYDDWLPFHDMFTSLVHNNETLSMIQKLHYLKSSLSGEAEILLKHILVTEANYIQAWETLKKRYGNKRLMVNSLLKRLFSQKKINLQNSGQIKFLLDTTSECLNSLSNLKVPIDSWDPIIIHLTVLKLDIDTHKQWEEYSYKDSLDTLPTWSELRSFLETKFRTLELVTSLPPATARSVSSRTYHINSPLTETPTPKPCVNCKESHTLSHCKEFAKLIHSDKIEVIKNNNLCFNCLTAGHSVNKCRIPVSCHLCRRRHHTLLHQPRDTQNVHHSKLDNYDDDEGNDVAQNVEETIAVISHFTTQSSTALLATALVPVRDDAGQVTILRALLDQGSQASFITERAAQLMQLSRTSINGTVTGVGSTRTTINHSVYFEICSRYDSNFNLKVKAYIMSSRLTSQLPIKSIKQCTDSWSHLQGLTLADPSYHSPGRIDLLLGVDTFAHILQADIVRGPPGSPCAQSTSLGWILFGSIQQVPSQDINIVAMHHRLDFDIDQLLRNLWEDDSPVKPSLTADEKLCEHIFNSTTARSIDGRYIVKLPTKVNELASTRGQTREMAYNRLKQLEKRFSKHKQFEEEYRKVIADYIVMKHMEKIPLEEINKPSVYLPHHAVVKEEKETTKVRVVFDASCKGVNNVSLNDELLIGPQLQEDMRNIMMRWRMKKVCFLGDVQKMYRQIYVSKEDADLQRIVWKHDTDDDIADYRLLRVTFGTASAPYLAVKVLQQIADDEGGAHVEAVRTIKEDFYVDDLMSGQDTVDAAIDVARNITEILNKGGLVLQKWSSNSAEFLSQIQPDHRSACVNLNNKLDGTTRALGLLWSIGDDIFQYQLNLSAPPAIITKRNILAETQKLFDPLGWLIPCIVPAKIIIQKLWLQRSSWDDEVEPETKREWLELRESYKHLQDIRINRWLHTTSFNLPDITIHGFCDASVKAYAAVAYLRIKDEDGTYKTSIIAAKARVAPVKPVSLPRLELCGAVLLARLLKQIGEAMRISNEKIFSWTDSTIVLSWLQGDPNRWQTYVRNRVVSILDDTGNKWFHVQSQDNPADVASRGILLPELVAHELWWNGPKWLSTSDVPYRRLIKDTDLESKPTTILCNTQIENTLLTRHFEDFDNLTQLIKTIAICKRFLIIRKSNMDGMITTEEMDKSLKVCVKLTQKESFYEEIEALRKNKPIRNDSRLKTLNAYLDCEGILRVGGRLQHSKLIEESKHPMILDSKTKLALMIVADAHQRTLHGGSQLMICYIRAKFWILKPKNIVKAHVRRCLICARQSASTRYQIMGDLPKERVTPARPFLHSGVDFTGPYLILTKKGRGGKTLKAYIALFICLSTKAIHLELVGDMTSEAFIGAYKRFVSRRGKCSHLWSDQGRNFVGANKELKIAFEEAQLEITEFPKLLTDEGTQWHFIPAYSPNFGGLWEAGVKSVKYHLKRILNCHLTYEEMSTLLCEIEACLNSRPLSPTDDDNVDNILTPGHFLIGEAPINVPAPDLRTTKINYLSRWQHSQKLLRDFWHRWQEEYLSRLQQRPKWLKRQEEFSIGQIVLIKSDNLPPGKWLMGRVIEKHPGPDGITRVYSIKSGDHIVRRSISKLCLFPVNIDD